MQQTTTENKMKGIKVGKVTLNIACGESGEKLERAFNLAQRLTGTTPVRTLATRRARTFRIRRGLPIGVKVTMRGQSGVDFLKKVLPAKENKISSKSFDNEGNFAFGISEYLDIPGQKYDPTIGMFGMNVIVSLERPGFRIKRRKLKKSRVGGAHRITKENAIEFITKELGMKVE
jgi:large subunit ribosomal protein L5